MKKVIGILLIALLVSSAYALGPVAYKAKLEPPKSMALSGGTSASFTTIHADFTYGFNKSNLHAKINLQGTSFYLEGLMQHHIGEVQTIDMGFSYGGRIRISTGTIELSPEVLWNMSYQLASNVAFYGGLKFNFDMGVNTWGFYTDFDLNGYLGTQIDLVNNLKLYVEIQPNIWSGASNGYLGVNYYFGKKSSSMEMPDA